MAEPYIFYRPPETSSQRQFAPNTDVEEQRVRAEATRYVSDNRLLQEYQKELGKTDERLLKARLAEKKQRYGALAAANSTLQKQLQALSKAGTDTFAAEARAAATAYAATIKAQVDLVQAQYAFDPGDYVGFISNMKVAPDAAIAALTGSMQKLAQTGSKYMQPALINKILAQVFLEDPRKLNIESDRDELISAFREKGVSETVIDSFLASRDMALEAWNAVKAENDIGNRSLAMVNDVIARGITNEAEIKTAAAELQKQFTAGIDSVATVTGAEPSALLASIDDDSRALDARDTLQKRVDDLWKQREAYGMQDEGAGDPDGRILADDNFRLWAADNGYEDIGSPQYDEEGNITGAAKGRQYYAALREYNWQMKRPGKWNDMLKQGGGSSTGQVVEVSYVPADAPKAAVVGGNVYVKIGDQVWTDGPDGTFVQADEPEGAEWSLAAKRDGEGFTAVDSVEGLTINDVVVPEGTGEKAAVSDLYAKKVIGEREAQQAGFIQQYGRDGYVAVRDPETGERTEIDGSLKPTVKVLSGGYSGAGRDSALRKSLRQAARGNIPGAGKAKADGKPVYQFGGVTVVEGEPSTDPGVMRLRERIAGQKAASAVPSVIEPILSSSERRRKEALQRRFPPMPSGSVLPDEPVADEAIDRPTPTRVEGLSYEGMAEDYKRRNLSPTTSGSMVETRSPLPPSETVEAPTVEDVGLISPTQADRNSDAYWRDQQRKQALAAKRAAAQQ